MTSRAEKGAAGFEGLKLLLCENPLPPIDEAIVAAQAEAPRGNLYTEAYSAPLRGLIGERLGVPERLLHVNAGSELILRQLFDRLGQQAHLLTPTYALFPEIARRWTETPLDPGQAFAFDLARLEVPRGTTLVVIVVLRARRRDRHEAGTETRVPERLHNRRVLRALGECL